MIIQAKWELNCYNKAFSKTCDDGNDCAPLPVFERDDVPFYFSVPLLTISPREPMIVVGPKSEMREIGRAHV